MSPTCVVVAGESGARVFERASRRESLATIKTFDHPEGRLHEHDLTQSAPGRSFDSAGQGRHNMEPRSSAKRTDAKAFARQVANWLNETRKQGRIERLIVIAAPAFLGLLRGELDSATSRLVENEIDKNLTHMTAQEIAEYL